MKPLFILSIAQAATIYFKSNYEVVQDGPLLSGSNATIDYDMERAKCPQVESHGSSLWSVRLGYSLNGVNQPEIRVHSSKSSQQTVIPRLEKGELAVWFTCYSAGGVAHDSNFGENFRFRVIDQLKPSTIVFKKDYTNEVQGALFSGGSVLIDYAEERATCSSAPLRYGQETKNAVMYYSMNGKPPQEATVLRDRKTIQPTIQNLEKGTLSIWFQCSSMKDTTFDSDDSKNFNFVVQ